MKNIKISFPEGMQATLNEGELKLDIPEKEAYPKLNNGVNDIQLTENFNLYEFETRDGSVKHNPELSKKLQVMRNLIDEDHGNTALIVLNGYRNKEHNDAVRGAKNSQHLLGTAADVYVAGKFLDGDELAVYAEKAGFMAIGIASNTVHVDLRTERRRWRY